MEFLDQLNTTQRAAVTATEGPSLIVAGAGSGKTRVLTYRIAYLLSQGVPAGNILALTFTNKAAREMKERIQKLVGNDARYLWMGTFHSICVRLIRPYAEKLGYTQDFSIYDTTDMKSVIKVICKECALDEDIYKAGTVLNRISELKNRGVTPAQYGLSQQLINDDKLKRMYEFGKIYELYQQRLKASNAMDFDDLLVNTIQLMDNFPEAREQYQQQFKYVLIDEYQDTNYIQFVLSNRLTAPQNNICVVGDDAQSIYSFRGADIRNILNFQKHYPGAKLFKLERNYRSTQNIVNAANSLIHKNIKQIEKNVYSEKETGTPISLQKYPSELEEASGVAKKILKLQKEGYSAQDIAVLYRTNAQSRALESELLKYNIISRVYGGTSFYQRKEVKDSLAYLRISINPYDNEALIRIIGYPSRGIGKTTMSKVASIANANNLSYLDVMRSPNEVGLDVNVGTKSKLQLFAKMIDGFLEQSKIMGAYEFAEMVYEKSGVKAAIKADTTPDGIEREQNLDELLTAIHEFEELKSAEEENVWISDFLSEVSLLTDQDLDADAATNCVVLSTVHAAKGLEFPIVFIVGLEENLFPLHVYPIEELEEERRLLYVAITRAMEQCYLSYTSWRFRNGKGQSVKPSIFLMDIDKKYIGFQRETNARNVWSNSVFHTQDQYSASKNYSNPGISTTPISGATSTIASSVWKASDRVTHRVFGDGTVVRVYRDEVTENDKIEINFDTQGTKTLLLTHAKLEKI